MSAMTLANKGRAAEQQLVVSRPTRRCSVREPARLLGLVGLLVDVEDALSDPGSRWN